MERLTIDEVIAHCDRQTARMEAICKPSFFEEASLSSDWIKRYWEHKQVASWLKELEYRREAARSMPAVKMVEYEGEWVPVECCTFTNPLTSGGESYIDDAETPCNNCDGECSACVIQRVMDDYARVTGQTWNKPYIPETVNGLIENATAVSELFASCGFSAENMKNKSETSNEITYADLREEAKKHLSVEIKDYRPASGMFIPGMSQDEEIPYAIVCWLEDDSEIIYIKSAKGNGLWRK